MIVAPASRQLSEATGLDLDGVSLADDRSAGVSPAVARASSPAQGGTALTFIADR